MKASKLRELSVAELEQKLNETVQKLFQLKFKNASGQLKNPLEIRLMRRDIARIKTVLAESKLSKEREEQREKG
ncbi:50S ribosomal protein L29 [bacterium]|nr:50S ribosomal protein L29 [bacterium]NIN92284.1 50S ribosomal protein L29 [bacterium]NIO18406.1 50S ribosomal protein L29 [bacterium]NIO73399.1 50S ribosomal protein L29 [bacterium]